MNGDSRKIFLSFSLIHKDAIAVFPPPIGPMEILVPMVDGKTTRMTIDEGGKIILTSKDAVLDYPILIHYVSYETRVLSPHAVDIQPLLIPELPPGLSVFTTRPYPGSLGKVVVLTGMASPGQLCVLPESVRPKGARKMFCSTDYLGIDEDGNVKLHASGNIFINSIFVSGVEFGKTEWETIRPRFPNRPVLYAASPYMQSDDQLVPAMRSSPRMSDIVVPSTLFDRKERRRKGISEILSSLSPEDSEKLGKLILEKLPAAVYSRLAMDGGKRVQN